MPYRINSIRRRVLNREVLSGTFLNLACPATVEMAGFSGLDWVLIDCEHGPGGYETMVHQIRAAGITPAAPIVRIAANDTPTIKRVLDVGAAGVMVPWIRNAEDATNAVSAMRYPPQGVRGVASSPRATSYGLNADEYLSQANDLLLTIIQIERSEAVDDINAIAAIDGVDVLFIGPMDLSVSLGHPQQWDHPKQREAYRKVAVAAKNAGKAAGILLAGPNQIDDMADLVEMGYTFIAAGSDGGLVGQGMGAIATALNGLK
jgi:2-keto-3-deoxy-L-rhamnonate aldolase RhmA